MNWQHFQTHNEAPTKSFEALCNQLFDLWCREEYLDTLISVIAINGAAGDGGVESLALLNNGECIGMQAKWFPDTVAANRIQQIKSSVQTALKVRPSIKKYIVCIPRDLSSLKSGHKGKPVENHERARWDTLQAEIESEYPCRLVLWDEIQLLTRLQNKNAAGIYRYWFEKAEISYESIQYNYDKQRAGWLAHKYIPDLHISGQISEILQEILGTDFIRQNLLLKLDQLEMLCNALQHECLDYQQYDVTLQENLTFSDEITKSLSVAEELSHEVGVAKERIQNDVSVGKYINSDKWYCSFQSLVSLLEEGQYSSDKRAHKDALLKAAKSLDEYDITLLLNNLKKLDQKFALILGEPGTGKTHGIASQLDFLFTEKRHIGILIRSKDYESESGWRSILAQALGISGQWTELEIWNALESLANRLDVDNTGSETHIKSKVLICIDGVDERIPFDSWIERFRETEAICTLHNRLRFCVTCRPYVFSDLPHNDILLRNQYFVPVDGDVPVSDLYSDYIRYYRIDDTNCQWIKWSLKTPLALRTFCELYKDQSVHKLDVNAEKKM